MHIYCAGLQGLLRGVRDCRDIVSLFCDLAPARFKRRRKPEHYRPIPPLEREAPGSEPRQRPLTQQPKPLEDPQLDNIYHDAHVGEITAELVRPRISAGNQWGGWTVDKMRIAFLARSCQTRLPYVHSCSAMYCLKIVDGTKELTMHCPTFNV